jgi:hypothetical protein
MPSSSLSDRPVARLAPRYSVRDPLGRIGRFGTTSVVLAEGEPISDGAVGEVRGVESVASTVERVVRPSRPQADRNAAADADKARRRKARRSSRGSWTRRSMGAG